jgi:hypothetical protein
MVAGFENLGGQVVKWRAKSVLPGWDWVDWSAKIWGAYAYLVTIGVSRIIIQWLIYEKNKPISVLAGNSNSGLSYLIQL